MNPRIKSLLLIMVLVITAALFFFTPIRNMITADQTQPSGGLVDSPEEFTQAQMAAYTPLELFPQFGIEKEILNGSDPSKTQENLGDETTFWVYDQSASDPYQVTAALQYKSEMVMMYVDVRHPLEQAALETAAQEFENKILPTTRSIFGNEVSPDEPISILHTPLESAGGYFSYMDLLPAELNPISNQRKLFVIGTNSYQPGTDAYLSILAHELQHMIHAHQQPESPAWFNEALSTISQDMNGYPDDELAMIYLGNPDVSLTGWSQDAAVTGAHYGAGNLFLRYIIDQYLGDKDLSSLLVENAGSDLQVFAQMAAEKRADVGDFSTLVMDWAVANLLNDRQAGDGRYAYDGLPAYVSLIEPSVGQARYTVNQFGADYIGLLEGPVTIQFDGEETVSLVGMNPIEGKSMWWSNRADSKLSTLTRTVDLTNVKRASLTFSAWYEIEKDFDYAYVTVSTDGGKTWQTIPGKTTTSDNPNGTNMGNGLTGVSGKPEVDVGEGQRGRWIDEMLDLTHFAGQKILLRFWLVNDADFNAPGLLLDHICIAEIGYCDNAEEEDGAWQTEGFLRVSGNIAQAWEVRLVTRTASGINVQEVGLDAKGQGKAEVKDGDAAVLVVMGATSHTDEPGNYQVRIIRK